MVRELTHSLQVIGFLHQLMLVDLESGLHNSLHECSLHGVL